MKKAFAYYRVSTDEQAQEGKSIEAQGRICRKWAEDNDFKIIHEFRDEGKSGTNLNRPALKDLLARLEESGIEALIVQDTDRLARDTLDHLTVKAVLKKYGARLISVSQPMIDSSPEGNLIDTIIASVNAFQSQITGRKTSKVLAEKAKIGIYPGNAPLGYINAENPRPTGTLDRKIIMPDPENACYITDAFNMYATGNYSCEDITEYLNSKHVLPRKGGEVARTTIEKLLKNEFYIGVFMWGGVSYKGVHTPLLATELFSRVQSVMTSHRQGASRMRVHSFLLKGFLVDSKDESKMIGDVHKKKNGTTYRFYFSPKHKKGTYIDSETLETQVEKIFDGIQISESYKNELVQKAKELAKKSQEGREEEKRSLTNRIAEIDNAIKELEDSRFVKHEINNETFMRVYGRYETDRNTLLSDLSKTNKDYSRSIRVIERILELAEDIGNAYRNAEPILKRNYLGLFIKRMFVDKSEIVDIELTDAVNALLKDGEFDLDGFGVGGGG